LYRYSNKGLSKAVTVAITVDCWTSKQTLAYIGVTVHYIDPEFNFQSYTLNVEVLEGSHTGAVLKNKIVETLNSNNIIAKVYYLFFQFFFTDQIA